MKRIKGGGLLLSLCLTLLLAVVALIVQSGSKSQRLESRRRMVVAEQDIERIAATKGQLIRIAQVQAQLCEAVTGERIIELPDDGNAYHVSVLLHDDWRKRPRERALVAWFSVDAGLRSLRAQVHWHIYTENNRLYRWFQPLSLSR